MSFIYTLSLIEPILILLLLKGLTVFVPMLITEVPEVGSAKFIRRGAFSIILDVIIFDCIEVQYKAPALDTSKLSFSSALQVKLPAAVIEKLSLEI